MSSSDMESSTVVWESLYRSDRSVVDATELARLARRLGKEPAHVIRHLRRGGYLLPLLKGYYYVRSPEEIRLGTPRLNPRELFALAAKAKDLGSWYYCLHTALSLNGMTHEERRDVAVASDRFYRIRGVPIAGRRFVVHKWSPDLFGFGIERRGLLRYSDPEKTVLDYAYWDHWRTVKGHAPTGVWREHVSNVDARRLRAHLPHYPAPVRASVEAVL